MKQPVASPVQSQQHDKRLFLTCFVARVGLASKSKNVSTV